MSPAEIAQRLAEAKEVISSMGERVIELANEINQKGISFLTYDDVDTSYSLLVQERNRLLMTLRDDDKVDTLNLAIRKIVREFSGH
jgi:hypothetical protein